MELARGYIITGFSGCLLGHTVAKVPLLIQGASHGGLTRFSAWLILLAVVIHLLIRMIGWNLSHPAATGTPYSWRPIFFESSIGIGVLMGVVAYGFYEVDRTARIAVENKPLFTRRLDPRKLADGFRYRYRSHYERSERSWESYLAQTQQAARQLDGLDLIVWPESMFTRKRRNHTLDGDRTLPRTLVDEQVDVTRLEQVVAQEPSGLSIQAIANLCGHSGETALHVGST